MRRKALAAAFVALMTLGLGLETAPSATAAPSRSDRAVMQTTTQVQVRTGPGARYRVHTVLERGTVVRTTGRTQNGYTRIVLDGDRYWVLSRYLRRSNTPTPTPTSRPTPTPVPGPTVAPTPPPPSDTPAPTSWWKPKVGASFQVQYTGRLDLSLPVDVYNLDHEGASKADIAQLRARGVDAICYFNAGATEDWRADKNKFPAAVVGKPLDGWPGERWLDIRRLDVLVPIMAARMDDCKAKGFVAVDPDNTDGWQQDTGFSIKGDHQVAYQRALAEEAHKRGLAIGLKNNIEQLDRIAPFVDFAVNEQCYQYRECNAYAGLLKSGKAVFNIEYSASQAACDARPAGMATIFKDLELSARRSACSTG